MWNNYLRQLVFIHARKLKWYHKQIFSFIECQNCNGVEIVGVFWRQIIRIATYLYSGVQNTLE